MPGISAQDFFSPQAAPAAPVDAPAPAPAAAPAAPAAMSAQQFFSAAPPPSAANAAPATPATDVAPLRATDGGAGMTNLSPANLARIQQGLNPLPDVPPAAAPAPAAAPPGAMAAAAATPAAPPPPAAAAPPAAPPGPMTGPLANAGAGTSDVVAGTLGAPVDLATGALNLASRGVKAATGLDMGQITNPVGGSDSFKSAMGLIGADPRNVVPANGVDQIARGVGEGVASAVLPWSIARALPVMSGAAGAVQSALGSGTATTQAVAGAGSGLGSTVAQQMAPDSLKPVAGMVGGMVGGGLTLGSVAATRKLIDTGVPMAANVLKPFTAAGRQDLAGQRIMGAASDPEAVQATLNNPAPQLVPGSQPTTYQATGDAGLGTLERVAAKNNPDMFLGRAAAQNTARNNALQQLAPAHGSPEAVGQQFQSMLSAIDANSTAAVNAARTTAQKATSELGQAVPAGADQQGTALQTFGDQMRGSLTGPMEPRKEATRALYNAVDPDGTLRVNMTPVRDAANAIAAARPSTAAPFEGEPGRILDTARMQPSVVPFSELAGLKERTTDAMRAELSTNGSSQTYRMLTQVLDSVHQAMQSGVEDQATHEATAAAAGTPVASPISERMAAASAPPEPAPVLPPARTAPRGGPAPSAVSLLTFLRRAGGIRDQGGELAAMDTAKQRIGLVRKSGLSLDYAREAAEEAGYLHQDSGTNDLLDAISEELHGRRVYTIHEQAEMDAYGERNDQEASNEHDRDMARSAVLTHLDDMGGSLSAGEIEHAADLTAGGMHPVDAIHQVGAAGDDRALSQDFARQNAGPPGMPGASQPRMGLGDDRPPAAPGAPANFDAAAYARYAAARKSSADFHSDYTNAPGVGRVVAPGRVSGEFKLGESAVPSNLMRNAETAQAYLKVGGDQQAAENYLTFNLRRAAEGEDGTLDAAKYGKWMQQQSEVMHAFPELGAKFGTAAKASSALDDAMATQVQQRQVFEQSAARHFLGDADPVDKMGQILRSGDAAATMQSLAKMTATAPAARAGLQKATVDYILRDLRSNADMGPGLPPLLKSDAFQTFAKKTPAALSAIFSPEQVQSIRSVAADLQQSNRSITGTKLPGGSNTAQDLAGGEKHGAGGHGEIGDSLMAEIAGEAAGEIGSRAVGGVGSLLGALIGHGTTLGAMALNAASRNGLKKVDDIVAQAMLHPAVAKDLLMRVSDRGSKILAVKMLSASLRKANASLVQQKGWARYRPAATASAVMTMNGPPPQPPPPSPQQRRGTATPYTAPPVVRHVPFGLVAPAYR